MTFRLFRTIMTYAKACGLAYAWRPPEGIDRALFIGDDGDIAIFLHCGGLAAVSVCVPQYGRWMSLGDVIDSCDRKAAVLLAESTAATDREVIAARTRASFGGLEIEAGIGAAQLAGLVEVATS